MSAIQHTLDLTAGPETVYRAAATPEGIHAWWCKDSDIATTIGAESELRFVKDGKPVLMRFRLDTLKEGSRVRWSCIDNDNPAWIGTTLTWDVRPTKGGCQLAFRHDGFKTDGPPFEMTAQGWQHFMGSFKQYAETGTGQPW